LYKGKRLKDYDCIFAKGSFRYAPLLRAITTMLYEQTYMPIKASAFTMGHDKLLTQLKKFHKYVIVYLSKTDIRGMDLPEFKVSCSSPDELKDMIPDLF